MIFPSRLGGMKKRDAAVFLVCFVAVAIRIWILWARGPLWLDEAHLAAVLINRSWGEMLLPLGNDQIAPLGFLLLAKASSTYVRNFELALRLPAFLAGTMVIPVALWVSRLYKLDAVASAVLLMLVCFALPFVRYSAEFKQYSFEILFGFAILGCFEMWRQNPSLKRLALVGCVGFLCVFFTIAAPFLLFFPGAYIVFRLLGSRRWLEASIAGTICLGWVVSYIYLLNIVAPLHGSTVDAMQNSFWMSDLLPRKLVKIPRWIVEHDVGFFEAIGFAQASIAALFVSVIGASAVYKKDKWGLCGFVAPGILVFLAAVCRIYPFAGRLILFAVPGVLVLMVIGLGQLRKRFREIPSAIFSGAFLLFFFPVVTSAGQFLKKIPFGSDDLPSVFSYVNATYETGDTVYISSFALPFFRVYGKILTAPTAKIVLGHDPRAEFGNEFDEKKPANFQWFMDDIRRLPTLHRVWLIMARENDAQAQVLRQSVLYFCRTHGRIEQQFKAGTSGAFLCVFDSTDFLWSVENFPMPEYRPIHKSYLINLPK